MRLLFRLIAHLLVTFARLIRPGGVRALANHDNVATMEGGEHEVTDPAGVYYAGNGNFYESMISRNLAQQSAGGLSGAGPGGGPSGNSIAMRSGPRLRRTSQIRSLLRIAG